MTGNASFHKINYSIRTNKNIERKLVFGHLQKLCQPFEMHKYRYIGFGSMWFIDFVLAHRALGISDMRSIEREDNADRAKFNAPYDCIDVRAGSSSKVISAMTTSDWSKPSVAWLDYDGIFDEDARNDCERYLASTAPGSVIITTVNAHKSSYKTSGDNGDNTSVGALREIFGDAVPANVPPAGKRDVSAVEFPEALSFSILNFMTAAVRRSGRTTEGFQDRFVPLFKLSHADNAPMCTVGGMVISWRHVQILERVFSRAADEILSGACALEDLLDLIPITLKEKLFLDRMLPCEQAGFAVKYQKSELKINLDQAEKYRKFYTHFPLFAETLL